MKDVHVYLRQAGLMKETKNWYNILYNTINKSRKFQHVGPGEYKLIKKPVDMMIDRVMAGESPSKVIDETISRS